MSRPRPAITRRRALLGGAALVTYLSLGEGVAKAAGLTITAELERARVSVGEGVRNFRHSLSGGGEEEEKHEKTKSELDEKTETKA